MFDFQPIFIREGRRLAEQETCAMFYSKEAFEPVEELSTDLWARYGIPDILLADNSRFFIRAMFLEDGVRLEAAIRLRDEVAEDDEREQ